MCWLYAFGLLLALRAVSANRFVEEAPQSEMPPPTSHDEVRDPSDSECADAIEAQAKEYITSDTSPCMSFDAFKAAFSDKERFTSWSVSGALYKESGKHIDVAWDEIRQKVEAFQRNAAASSTFKDEAGQNLRDANIDYKSMLSGNSEEVDDGQGQSISVNWSKCHDDPDMLARALCTAFRNVCKYVEPHASSGQELQC